MIGAQIHRGTRPRFAHCSIPVMVRGPEKNFSPQCDQGNFSHCDSYSFFTTPQLAVITWRFVWGTDSASEYEQN